MSHLGKPENKTPAGLRKAAAIETSSQDRLQTSPSAGLKHHVRRASLREAR